MEQCSHFKIRLPENCSLLKLFHSVYQRPQQRYLLLPASSLKIKQKKKHSIKCTWYSKQILNLLETKKWKCNVFSKDFIRLDAQKVRGKWWTQRTLTNITSFAWLSLKIENTAKHYTVWAIFLSIAGKYFLRKNEPIAEKVNRMVRCVHSLPDWVCIWRFVDCSTLLSVPWSVWWINVSL